MEKHKTAGEQDVLPLSDKHQHGSDKLQLRDFSTPLSVSRHSDGENLEVVEQCKEHITPMPISCSLAFASYYC